MFETSRIELSQSALQKNISFLRRRLPPGVVFTSVIKGNAYGHGIDKFLPMAEKCGLRGFAVFSADEALVAKDCQTEKSHIMIMGAIRDDEIGWAIENDVSFYVFDRTRLAAARKAAKKLKTKARVHIELETGLNRTGFSERQFKPLSGYVERHLDYLSVEGICTHLAGAETMNNFHRIQEQIATFGSHVNLLAGFSPAFATSSLLKRHMACSAAVFSFPESVMDMVRIGIAQYGFWPSKETEVHHFTKRKPKRKRKRWVDPLRRVLKWCSEVMDIKRVSRGEYVGYGSSSLVTRPLKVAAVPVGYFHGFARNLSNRGHVLVGGQRAPVIGTVNMNMMMVDITDIPDVKRGDEVVIIGKQKDNTISVGSFGEMTRFINYELLVGLPSEIPRIIVD